MLRGLGGGGQRRPRHSIGGDLRPNPLREALRNRGGAAHAPRAAAPAQTDVEDNVRQKEQVEKPTVSLDWLNLTAFAPQSLQSAIDKLRAADAPLVALLTNSTESDSDAPGNAGRSGVTSSTVQGSRGAARPQGHSLRSALQARGGAVSVSVAETIPEDAPLASLDHPLCGDPLTGRPFVEGGTAVCEVSPRPAHPPEQLREAPGAEHAEDADKAGHAAAEAGLAAAEASPTLAEAAAAPEPPADEPRPAAEATPEGADAAAEAAASELKDQASAEPAAATPTPVPEAIVSAPINKVWKPKRTLKNGASWVLPKDEAETPKAVKQEKITGFHDASKYWTSKSNGFAGPALGKGNRLSKNEAQATLQRLLSMGHAVDFDEVRRLRKIVAEMEIKDDAVPAVPAIPAAA